MNPRPPKRHSQVVVSASPTPEAILKRGFLPENLPPPLTSASFWDHYKTQTGSYLVTQNCVGALAPYNASKRGGQRRVFSLPHPTFVHDQAYFAEKHWADLCVLFKGAYGSLSTPEFRPNGPRAIRITPHSDLPQKRLIALSRFKFCLVWGPSDHVQRRALRF